MKIEMSGIVKCYSNFQYFTCMSSHKIIFNIVVRNCQQEI